MGGRRRSEFQKQIEELNARSIAIEAEIAAIDVAIRSMPAGAEKVRLGEKLRQAKHELGLTPEPKPNPRDHWTWDRWEARANQLKTEARAWSREGHSKKADACLREGKAAAERARVLKEQVLAAPIAKR